MLTPDYLATIATPIVTLWSEVEDDIIRDIVSRIVKKGSFTEVSKWQIAKLREMGLTEESIATRLAKMTKKSDTEIQRIVGEACQESASLDDPIYVKAGLRPIPIASSPALKEVVAAGARKTQMLMRNFTGTTANTASMAFENAMDRAYLQIMSGAFSTDQAIRLAVVDLACKGMESIAYPSGHIEKLDVAARRAILTGANQATAEMQIARAGEMESDLVETTSHAGARPSHAVWQGKVFSLSGRTRGYGNFYAETGYGTGEGLCGWNCRHSFFPFFLGISTRTFERDPAARLGKSNDQVYEESQKQRAYERSIRESKRECVALDAAVAAAQSDELRAALKQDFAAASVKLKRREAKLAQFLEDTSRTRDAARESVVGFGRSTSAKAVWANRKATQ